VDGAGQPKKLRGVSLSDHPLGANEGARGDAVLAVDFPEDVDLAAYEWPEDGKGNREWHVPAAFINERATITELWDEELSG
jgi:hypothetical protein